MACRACPPSAPVNKILHSKLSHFSALNVLVYFRRSEHWKRPTTVETETVLLLAAVAGTFDLGAVRSSAVDSHRVGPEVRVCFTSAAAELG